MVEPSDVRRIWWLSETVHNVSYFAPEGRAATDSLGCKGLWMGYFGMRAAPLGAVARHGRYSTPCRATRAVGTARDDRA
jgi:hypothetical protein